jgi:hypothetical protein
LVAFDVIVRDVGLAQSVEHGSEAPAALVRFQEPTWRIRMKAEG